LSGILRQLLTQRKLELDELHKRVSQAGATRKQAASESEACHRLLAIPGVESITATIVIAAIRHGVTLTKGREFGAWLGMVPSERSTGGKQKLLGVSKPGHSYLRRLFVHGARAVLQPSAKPSSSLQAWLARLNSRTIATLAVALANQLAA